MNIFGRKSKKDGQCGGKSGAGTKVHQCQVLGVPLKQAVKNSPSFDGIAVPAVVRECLDYVTLNGLHVEGIYRVSSPKSRLDELEQLANSDKQNEIIFQDAHEAANLLKRFLRQLPEHILTSQLHKQFDDVALTCQCDAQQICTCKAALEMKELLLQLPAENFHLLGFVFRHAQLVIQQKSHNKMGLAALGVLLQAMFSLSRHIVKMFILNASDLSVDKGRKAAQLLFDTVDTRPYLKPKDIDELRQNAPNTIKDIKEEISKQQNLLEHLHEQIQQKRLHNRVDTKAKEDEMWAIQTGITVLKRRLKALQDEAEHGDSQESQFNGNLLNGDGTNGSMDESTNSALLEKQLLAVQMALREEIGEEKRKIAHLLSTLRELRARLPEKEQSQLTISQRTTNNESQNRPRSIVSIRSSNGLDSKQSATEDGQSPSSSGNWEELCRAEESRREELLAELIRYRRICAQLRARLEHDTMLVKLKQQQKPLISAAARDTAEQTHPRTPEKSTDSTNLLVTRF